MQITVEYFEPKPFNWWVIIAIIGWILFFIVLYCWLGLPDLEAHNCVAENGGVSIPQSSPTASARSTERIRSGRKQLLPVLGLASIDLSIIAKIESSNDPLAYNPKSKARGLYQITPICLKDYNQENGTNLPLRTLFDPKTNEMVAKWYLMHRIPQFLRNKGIPITVVNILWAYNAGIRMVVKGIMPRETRNYIVAYYNLAKTK